MARPIEVTVDPELRHRLGAGADLTAGSRMLAARIAARKRRHATVVALVAAARVAVGALAAFGAYELAVALL